MAKAVTLCVLFIISSFFTLHVVIGESNGLTIKLIHRDSPESPFYQPNLTFNEKIHRRINQSKTRLEYLSDFPTDIRSRVIIEGDYMFLTHIGIGTFHSTSEPYKSYYFLVDVGSSLTWLECHDCKDNGNHCLRPSSQPFPDRTSNSYHKMLCNVTAHERHPSCNPRDCIGDFCGYKIKYVDNSTTKGFLAYETFTFDTTRGTHIKDRIPNLLFGCGIDMINMGYPYPSKISGILGLGRGPRSFVTQLGIKSNGTFSYCLQPRTNRRNTSTFLHFGDNIPRIQDINTTPLLPYPSKTQYFVNLTGISVAGVRLNLTEQDFSRKPNNTGGCIIDSGSEVTHIINYGFARVKDRLVRYFDGIGGFVRSQLPGSNACFKRTGTRQGFTNIPTMTFHFDGADLFLRPENVFLMNLIGGREIFCLEMLPNNAANGLTTIGAYQQTNYRFSYYTRENVLKFGPENCTANA